MLILAGVSINAIVGENGILTKTQYATFLNEMAAVEEAVQMWKAGESIDTNGEGTKAIPTNGLCKVNDLTSTERLTGEIGYYRIWSMTETQPTTNILSSASEFNNAFESELIFYPAGVQDLYYLNNEACGIESKKTYLIDAATGMVYSMAGISLKGVSCYSSNMARAVMNGTATAPNFAEAEVSGSGAGDRLAGNVQDEYLPNGEKNPDYNPNGFQIITSKDSNSNIFKLYNNGDLYGKGIKKRLLNLEESELENLNSYTWKELEFNQELKNYKKIIPALNTMFIISSDDYLYAYGENTNNVMGLSEEELINYNGKEILKLKIGDNERVEKVYVSNNYAYVITKSGRIFTSGTNIYGARGIGDLEVHNEFKEIEIRDENNSILNSDEIEDILFSSRIALIRFTNNRFYFVGDVFRNFGIPTSQIYLNFIRCWDGQIGEDIDQDIDKIYNEGNTIIKKDKTIWQCGYTKSDGYSPAYDIGASNCQPLKQILKDRNGVEFGTNVTNYINAANFAMIERINNSGEKEFWVADCANIFEGEIEGVEKGYFRKLELPEKIKNVGVKDYIIVNKAFFLLDNSGKLWGGRTYNLLGINKESGVLNELICLNDYDCFIPEIDTIYNNKLDLNGKNQITNLPLVDKSGKVYLTGNSELMYGEKVYQSTWHLVAQNVKMFRFNKNNGIYLTKNNEIYVVGTDARVLGLGIDKNEPINNYTKCNSSIIQNIDIKEIFFNKAGISILTSNGELYKTGLYREGTSKYYPGWEDENNYYDYVKLLTDVKDFNVEDNANDYIALKDDGLYVWGANFPYTLGTTEGNIDIPTKVEFPADLNSIYKIRVFSGRTNILTENGLYYSGANWSSNNGASSVREFTKYPYEFNNERVKEVVFANNYTAYALTDNGNVFGYGYKKLLGINSTSGEEERTYQKLQIENVEYITAGNNFVICIKEDGTVWATGSNINGLLGRWKYDDRNQANSRYKTAFTWVECPELEI